MLPWFRTRLLKADDTYALPTRSSHTEVDGAMSLGEGRDMKMTATVSFEKGNNAMKHRRS